MATKRAILRAARRSVLRDLVTYLERDQAMSDANEILAIEALIVEFRRRAGDPPLGPPPGQQALPGMGMFRITLTDGEAKP